jgi:hypothetical protein
MLTSIEPVGNFNRELSHINDTEKAVAEQMEHSLPIPKLNQKHFNVSKVVCYPF